MATQCLSPLLHLRPTATTLNRDKSSLPCSFSFRSASSFAFQVFTIKTIKTHVNSSGKNNASDSKQQLNLSVLRFTLGIPGFDESNLPRLIGFVFGFLLLLNHFLGSNSITPSQLRSEVLGIFLAFFSITLPYLGKFLKGANPVDRTTLPEGNRQIFVMPENLSDMQKEDLAWGSYVLLRNTNSMSMLLCIQDTLCIRGYWNVPEDATKADIITWFKTCIREIGFSGLKDTLYFPQSTGSLGSEILPKGMLSLLVEPVLVSPKPSGGETPSSEGFILLASCVSYAYGDRDRAWIRAVANKFRGMHVHSYT